MADGWEAARRGLCAEIEREVAETAAYLGKTELDQRVMAAMAKVPRHLFVPEASRGQAYSNRPLPIGEGQTISQPYIVAVMSDLAASSPGDRVLDVGTGCGYQAAVLAELGCEVYSIERHRSLSERARSNLAAAGYGAVRLRCGDGLEGWPEAAPFAAILVAATWQGNAPPRLVAQMGAPGRMIIPLAEASRFPRFTHSQSLTRIEKATDGSLTEQGLLPVAFVPLIGES